MKDGFQSIPITINDIPYVDNNGSWNATDKVLGNIGDNSTKIVPQNHYAKISINLNGQYKASDLEVRVETNMINYDTMDVS